MVAIKRYELLCFVLLTAMIASAPPIHAVPTSNPGPPRPSATSGAPDNLLNGAYSFPAVGPSKISSFPDSLRPPHSLPPPRCSSGKPFRVLGMYTAKNDLAHISFVHEANSWLRRAAEANGFVYDSSADWSLLNDEDLKKYQVVCFLDTRPEKETQRRSFERYMKGGGGFMGFHFAAFALDSSAYENNWKWYHDTLLGSGNYKSNTWRPIAATLHNDGSGRKVMEPLPFMRALPDTFRAAPNEWYAWQGQLRENDSIQVLLSIHPSSFPLGTGPKAWEIWHQGDYPVAWTNRHYRMIYLNMGHNDMDYESGSDRQLSSSFSSRWQNEFVIRGLCWLGRRKR